jgi:hypothetical protein
MSRDEVRVRATQEISKRWDLARSKMRIRGLMNGRGLPFGGSGRFFFQAADIRGIVHCLRAGLPGVPGQIVETANRILRHKFDLLGYQALDYGREIDWHFDAVHGKSSPRVPWFRVPYLDFDRVGDHKVIWELSRHQHLVTLAKAYRFTQSSVYTDELFAQWYAWQEQNPYPIGINWASSLEVAFRSLSWLWVWHLLEGSAVVPPKFASDLRRALMQNGHHIERYLSTYFAPNTHLLGEAVALFFIGTLSPKSPAVQRWRDLGWRLILQEAKRQVQRDGMHFEQSTYYHVYALDFFLHARILADVNGIAVPPVLDDTIERMLDALRVLSAAGPLPQFGDDDGGRVFDPGRNQRGHMLDPLAIGAVLFRRGDFKRAALNAREEMVWLFGASGAKTFDELPEGRQTIASVALEASGIYVMSSSGTTRQQLVIDAGRQGPGWAGHGHADALSLQLAVGGKAILIDPGTFTYVTSDGERARFRETACHNTVQVDGVSQAEPAGPFKWTGLAHASVERWITGERFDLFAGSHSGYNRLAGPVVHRRCIFYLKSHFWLVRDVLEGLGTHQIGVSWSFAPGSLSISRNGAQFLGDDGATLTALFAGIDNFKHEVLQSWFSPRYGERQPSPLLRSSASMQSTMECATVFVPGHQENARLDVIQIRSRGHGSVPVHGYRFSTENETHEMFFSDGAGKWTTGSLTSDARFVCLSSTHGDDLNRFVICDGSQIEIAGRFVFASNTPVTKKEGYSRVSFHEAAGGVHDFLEKPVCAGPMHSAEDVRLSS